MVHNHWLPQQQKTVLCIDSYQDNVPRGRLYLPDAREYPFDSLTRLLAMIASALEEDLLSANPANLIVGSPPRGNLATFDLQILFRQHSSWQGVIFWKEQRLRHNFRSVLELIALMDSALCPPQKRDAV